MWQFYQICPIPYKVRDNSQECIWTLNNNMQILKCKCHIKWWIEIWIHKWWVLNLVIRCQCMDMIINNKCYINNRWCKTNYIIKWHHNHYNLFSHQAWFLDSHNNNHNSRFNNNNNNNNNRIPNIEHNYNNSQPYLHHNNNRHTINQYQQSIINNNNHNNHFSNLVWTLFLNLLKLKIIQAYFGVDSLIEGDNIELV